MIIAMVEAVVATLLCPRSSGKQRRGQQTFLKSTHIPHDSDPNVNYEDRDREDYSVCGVGGYTGKCGRQILLLLYLYCTSYTYINTHTHTHAFVCLCIYYSKLSFLSISQTNNLRKRVLKDI